MSSRKTAQTKKAVKRSRSSSDYRLVIVYVKKSQINNVE